MRKLLGVVGLALLVLVSAPRNVKAQSDTVGITVSPSAAPTTSRITLNGGTDPVPVNGNTAWEISQPGCSSFTLGSNNNPTILYAAVSGPTLGLAGNNNGSGTATVVVDGCNNATFPLIVDVGSGATPSPTSTPTAAPTASPGSVSYEMGANNVFPSSVLRNNIPSSPSVSPYSATWGALEFQSGINNINQLDINQVNASSADSNDSQFPLYVIDAQTNTATYTFTCIYSNICVDGHVVGVVGAFSGKNSDGHIEFMNNVLGRETDMWDVPHSYAFPSGGGNIGQVGSSGYCQYTGNGVNCATSNATDTPMSISSIDPIYLQAAETTNGSLPWAIGMGVMCADSSYVGPFASGSDGANTANISNYPKCAGKTGVANTPPEGTRGYLNMSDAQVNALSLAPYMKAIWRTMDYQHKGFAITDTIWGGASYGFNPYYIRAPYSAWQFAFTELGMGTVSSQTNLPWNSTGINLATQLVYCTNGTC